MSSVLVKMHSITCGHMSRLLAVIPQQMSAGFLQPFIAMKVLASYHVDSLNSNPGPAAVNGKCFSKIAKWKMLELNWTPGTNVSIVEHEYYIIYCPAKDGLHWWFHLLHKHPIFLTCLIFQKLAIYPSNG